MRRKRASILGMALLGLLALLLVPALSIAGKKPPRRGETEPRRDTQQLDLELCAPRENTFTLTIDNSYFPLPVGRQWVYQGREEGQTLGLRITVLNETETFQFRRRTVITRVVEEVEWVDANRNGLVDDGAANLIEISRNFFAQAANGTVCYFGEEVDIYEGGLVVSHEGEWRADERGNAPGIYMPANPRPGMTFQQEVAPGVAEDRATIIRRGRYRVPGGRFEDTITVRDFNPLDGSSGIKVYARGVGLIKDGPLDLIRYSG